MLVKYKKDIDDIKVEMDTKVNNTLEKTYVNINEDERLRKFDDSIRQNIRELNGYVSVLEANFGKKLEELTKAIFQICREVRVPNPLLAY